MKPPKQTRLKTLIKRFPQANILVVGDLILDEYIWGKVSRISPEAPVPVVWVNSENYVPGGCCNVAANIRSLGGRVALMGIVGRDPRGEHLLSLLDRDGICVEDIYRDPARPTTLKTRVIAHHQQVVRIDREQTIPVSKEAYRFFMNQLKLRIRTVDAVLIEDYGKGMITSDIVKKVVRLSKAHHKLITVDPKEDHLSFYRGVNAITPNHHEAATLARMKIKDTESLHRAGERLLKLLKCENVLITQGENGMTIFQSHHKPVRIPTVAQDVFDVSGAGDTVIGTFTLARALKASPFEAAYLANAAAGIVVGKVGTAAVTTAELLKHIRRVQEQLT